MSFISETEKNMIKTGDTVKVIASNRKKIEYIPIGTICIVRNVGIDFDGSQVCFIQSIDGYAFWYKESELEKGHTEWIKD